MFDNITPVHCVLSRLQSFWINEDFTQDVFSLSTLHDLDVCGSNRYVAYEGVAWRIIENTDDFKRVLAFKTNYRISLMVKNSFSPIYSNVNVMISFNGQFTNEKRCKRILNFIMLFKRMVMVHLDGKRAPLKKNLNPEPLSSELRLYSGQLVSCFG